MKNKLRCLLSAICLLAFTVCNCFAQKWTTKDFAISLHQLASQPENIYVNSGYTTVRPALYSLFGVADFFSAPFAANGFRFSVKVNVNGKLLEDAAPGRRGILFSNGSWQPDEVTRNGIYYRVADTMHANLKITTKLIPLYGKSGFVLTASFQNLDDRDVLVDAQETILPGKIFNLPLHQWTFGVPVSNAEVKQVDSLTWQGKDVALRAFKKNTGGLKIAPGQTQKMYWAVVMDSTASLLSSIDYEAFSHATKDVWQKRLDTYLQTVPMISSAVPGLADYYKRSLVSGLVCIWEKPSFLRSPYLSTSGMDGGAMNCYLWDLSYAANMVAQMFGKKAEDMLLSFKNIDLEKAYAITPDGKPSGVKYAYSPYSFTYLVSTLAKYLGMNKELFQEAKRLTENVEARASQNGLVDFGAQDNLLEMKTTGYEHFVVSPNAERAWSLRALANMNDATGAPAAESRQWRSKANDIATAIRTQLWDDSTGWFYCLYPSGHKEYVYSIQIYDAIHSGVCTPAMERKLLSRLADKQFLSPYGVSSVSQTDILHYEFNDTDWGGSGAYTGDGPQVAQMLYALGDKKLAWSVLQRFFWMGQQLAYFPQEHYVDKPQHPAHKRSNVIAGLMGAEVILYSMVGFQPNLNGTLWLKPKLPSGAELTVKDYQYKGQSFTVSFANNRCKIYKNGSILYEGSIKDICLLNEKTAQPTGVMVAPGTLSDASVTLVWHKPVQQERIAGYIVYVNEKEIAKTRQCNYRITGLLPSANYRITVAAQGTDNGLSAQTAAIAVKTNPRSQILNVVDFGARGDGRTLNTKAIQQAIDACPFQGTVKIPAGNFLSGAIHLKSNMTLLVEKGGTLHGSADEKDYLPMIRNRFEGWELDTYASLVNAGRLDSKGDYNTENISIRGEGSIAGGSHALAKNMIAQKGMRGRGRLICLLNCKNVEIQGLEIKDSPCWTIHYIYSSNITCHDLAISSTVENGDGIDPDSSVDCYIFNCSFATTDDCIAIKSGKNPEGYFIGKPTKHVEVTSCDFKSGHGISIGSEISGGISDVLVRDCKAGNLLYGLQIKGTPERGGIVDRIVVKDCQLRKISIVSKLPYNNDGVAAPMQPLFRDFEFSDIDMTEATEKEGIITINGFTDLQHYTTNLSFAAIKLPEAVSVKITNAKNIRFREVKTKTGKAPEYLLLNTSDIYY